MAGGAQGTPRPRHGPLVTGVPGSAGSQDPCRKKIDVYKRQVYARSAKAASLLSEQLRSRTFGKEYLAVVHGVPEGGVMTDLLGRDPVRRRTYVAAEPGKNVRPAELSYEVLGSREGLSLVRIRLHTGRTCLLYTSRCV